MFDFMGVAVLLALMIVFGWLTRRAWRLRNRFLRWTGSGLAGVASVVATLLLGAALLGYWKLNRSYPNPVREIEVAATPEHVARGEKFGVYCANCHAPEAGAAMVGNDFLDAPGAPPIGRFHAPNLTPAHLSGWSDGEIIRAIREGVHRNGRTLLIMPSSVLRALGDEDVRSIVAYLRSLPPQGQATPPNNLNVLGAIMIHGAPIIEAQPPVTEPVITPAPGPTPDYGRYLTTLSCKFCHGDDLMGDPEVPAPPLLTVPLMWQEQQFIAFMRTGNKPGGIAVDNERMPWKELGLFLNEDDDLRAIYAHLEADGRHLRQ